MRDINRIDPMLKEIGELWKKHPDLRLGQLICNTSVYDDTGDIFYWEDEDLMRCVRKSLENSASIVGILNK